MKSKQEIAELIFDKFREINSRSGHIVMMSVFRFSLLPELNPKEKELFSVVSMI